MELSFPTAFERLHTAFYRSKLTSWMAAQEEDYRCAASCLRARPTLYPTLYPPL